MAIKNALCVDSIEEIEALLEEKVQHIESYLINREICEDPSRGFQQLIPYVTFYTIDPVTNKIRFLMYTRPGGTDEQRLANRRSVGFGGHIDSDIDFTTSKTEDNGNTIYVMNKKNFLSTVFANARRELREELTDAVVDKYELDTYNIEYSIFKGTEDSDVNKVHICFSLSVELPIGVYTGVLKDKTNNNEITCIDEITFSLNIIPSHGMWRGLSDALRDEVNMEEWSRIAIIKIAQAELADEGI